MANKGWRCVSKRLVYSNPFINVTEDQVIDPMGEKTVRNSIEVVAGSVIIIPFNNSRQVFLVGQWRYAVNEYSWELPNGGINKGEAPLKAAKRELEEETGLVATKWTQIGLFHPVNGLMNRKVHVFLAEGAHNAPQRKRFPDAYERLDLRRVGLNKLWDLVNKDEIKDGFTLAAISKFYAKLVL